MTDSDYVAIPGAPRCVRRPGSGMVAAPQHRRSVGRRSEASAAQAALSRRAVGTAHARRTLQGDARRRRKEAAIRGAFFAAGIGLDRRSALLIVLSLVGQGRLVPLEDAAVVAVGRRMVPAAQTSSTSRRSSSARCIVAGDRDDRGHAARPGRGDLPLRVRHAASPAAAQADLEMLAGIPSVVMGFFALTVISPDIVQRLFASAPASSTWRRRGSASGSSSIPLVATIAEDALHAVPERPAGGVVRPGGAQGPRACGSCSRPPSPGSSPR